MQRIYVYSYEEQAEKTVFKAIKFDYNTNQYEYITLQIQDLQNKICSPANVVFMGSNTYIVNGQICRTTKEICNALDKYMPIIVKRTQTKAWRLNSLGHIHQVQIKNLQLKRDYRKLINSAYSLSDVMYKDKYEMYIKKTGGENE